MLTGARLEGCDARNSCRPNLLFDLANTRRLDLDQPDCKRSAELVIYNE